MNLKQLELFVEIADSGSFSKGAEATFITQSTASQHIAALEKEFDVRLLDRTGKGVMPTEAGKLLLEHARTLVGAACQARLVMERFLGMEDVHLKIGASTIPGDYLLPRVLPATLTSFPGIRITIVQGDSVEIVGRLKREEIELGIVGSRYDEEGVEFSAIGQEQLVLVVPPGHRWSDRHPLRLQELSEEPFIQREPGSGTGKTVEEALRKGNFDSQSLHIRACLGSNEAIKQAVASGLGVAFISETSVIKEVERGELAVVPINGFTISRLFFLASRAGRELSPAAKAFADHLLHIQTEGEKPGKPILSPPP